MFHVYFFVKKSTVRAIVFQKNEYPSFALFSQKEKIFVVTFFHFFVRERPKIEAAADHTIIPVTILSIFFTPLSTSFLLLRKIIFF